MDSRDLVYAEFKNFKNFILSLVSLHSDSLKQGKLNICFHLKHFQNSTIIQPVEVWRMISSEEEIVALSENFPEMTNGNLFFDRLLWSNKWEKKENPKKDKCKEQKPNWNLCLLWQRLLLCQVTVDGADGLEGRSSFFWVILWWECFIETYINTHYLV